MFGVSMVLEPKQLRVTVALVIGKDKDKVRLALGAFPMRK